MQNNEFFLFSLLNNVKYDIHEKLNYLLHEVFVTHHQTTTSRKTET